MTRLLSYSVGVLVALVIVVLGLSLWLLVGVRNVQHHQGLEVVGLAGLLQHLNRDDKTLAQLLAGQAAVQQQSAGYEAQVAAAVNSVEQDITAICRANSAVCVKPTPIAPPTTITTRPPPTTTTTHPTTTTTTTTRPPPTTTTTTCGLRLDGLCVGQNRSPR